MHNTTTGCTYGMKIVTICGSTRFRAEITEANRMLTLAGYVVLAPGVFAHDGDEITDEQKATLDALHLQKIDQARWIYVVNPGGYIGESTRREIAYARKTGKGVLTLADVGINGWTDEQRLSRGADTLDQVAATTEPRPETGTCTCGGQLDPVVDGNLRYCPDCRTWWEIHTAPTHPARVRAPRPDGGDRG